MPVLVVSSAEAAQEIMKTHELTFSDWPKLSIASKLVYEARDVAFACYGEYWRQMKSLCVLQLLNNKRVKSFRAVREQETALMIEMIKQSCSSSSSTTVNLSEMLVSLTNGVMCRVALGRKHSGRKFKELLGEVMELLGVFDFGRRYSMACLGE
ncbi:Cytochrome P450 71A24 [Camellia lanceoleosa]|nr:Cytochrome P450 71A24 [Camellia lanceoleosa]